MQKKSYRDFRDTKERRIKGKGEIMEKKEEKERRKGLGYTRLIRKNKKEDHDRKTRRNGKKGRKRKKQREKERKKEGKKEI